MTTSIYDKQYSSYSSSYKKSTPPMTAEIEKPRVVYSREAFDKIQYYVQKCSVECSGFGTVEKRDGYYFVTDVMLLAQRNGATSTEIEAEDLNRAMFELRNAQGEMNLWWHSHVNMGVFWSGTDTDTIHQIGDQGWCLATVFNKKGEMKSAVYHKNPFSDPALGAKPIFIDDLPTSAVPHVYPAETVAAWDAEYKKKITDLEEKYQEKKRYEWAGYRKSSDASSENSLEGTTNWRDREQEFDFSAAEVAYLRRRAEQEERNADIAAATAGEDDAPVTTSKFSTKKKATISWLNDFEDELKNPPHGWGRHEFAAYLKKHRVILTMDEVKPGAAFSYMGWGIETTGNLDWAKQEILMGKFKAYGEKEVERATH